MKARWLFFSFCSALLLISASSSFSQDEQKPQLLLLMQDNVKIGQEEAYLAAAKECNELFKKGGWPYLTFAGRYMSSFFYAMAIDNFAALDKSMDAFKKVDEAAGSGKFKDAITKANQNVVSSSSMLIALRPDLSYNPEDPVFEFNGDTTYNLYMETYHSKPEAVFEIEGVFKEALALHKNKKVRLPYQVYEVVFGPETPAYMVVIPSKDLAQFAEESKKAMELLGPEYLEFMKKNAHLVQCIEEKVNAVFLPDLCYFPEGK